MMKTTQVAAARPAASSTAPELGRDRAVLRLQDKPESTGEKKKQLVDQKAKGGV